MARKILTVVIFLFLIQKCAAALDEAAHLTIELNSGAVVVYADEDVIRGIKKDLGKEALPRMEPETLSNILKEKYPGKVETLVFHSAGKKVETDRNGQTHSIREAIIQGLIPPIEGLSMDEARILLGVFGFGSLTKREYSALSKEDEVTDYAMKRSKVAVFSGTSALDEIAIYYRTER